VPKIGVKKWHIFSASLMRVQIYNAFSGQDLWNCASCQKCRLHAKMPEIGPAEGCYSQSSTCSETEQHLAFATDLEPLPISLEGRSSKFDLVGVHCSRAAGHAGNRPLMPGMPAIRVSCTPCLECLPSPLTPGMPRIGL